MRAPLGRSSIVLRRALFLCVLSAALAPASAHAIACKPAQAACNAAADSEARGCRGRCATDPDVSARRACQAACTVVRDEAKRACRAVENPCVVTCGAPEDVSAPACSARVRSCREAARVARNDCRRECGGVAANARAACIDRCDEARASDEAGCGFAVADVETGAATLPSLPTGSPADLSLLDEAERAVITAADERAAEIRKRPVRLWIGAPGAEVKITQVRHGFTFGFPIDLRRFSRAEDLEWYADTMSAHFGLAVLENNAKWARLEPAPGVHDYRFVDPEVDWGKQLGLEVKGHTLLWGITPPFSSSGVPAWALERYASLPLSASRREELRARLRAFVDETVKRYRGRIGIWDVTNETLQALGTWFVDRLGPGIVDDMFRWANQADPHAQLVFNEWIVEVFTGFPNPTAADVRDRVQALLAAGVPVHAIGQQAHFVPAAAFAGFPVDLNERTRIDDYAAALDTLAEAGLPVHITETNFIAPKEPEARAAQAEGLLRLWWGHPAVEQIVFWGPWNKVAGRDEFDVGFWDDDKNITRHGGAVLSLLNDRWRTNLVQSTDASGAVEFSGFFGDYVAEWEGEGGPVHARFRVSPGEGPATIALLDRR